MAEGVKETTKEMTKQEFMDIVAESVKSAIKETGAIDVKDKGVVFDTPKTPAKDVEKLTADQKFNKFFKEGVFVNDTSVIKALGEGVGTTGGFLVPQQFAKEIIAGLPNISPVRKYSSVLKVGGLTGVVPKLTARPTASWGSENVAMVESDAAFGQLAWTLQRLDIFSKLSRELATDSVFDIATYLKNIFTQQYAAAENVAFTNGTGTGQPEGFRTATGVVSVAPATVNTVGYDDIVSLLYSLGAQYRSKAIFMTSTLGMERVKQIKDTTGRPIFDPNTNTLLGRAVVENPDIPANLTNGATTPVYDATEIWIGEFGYYYIFDSGEFEVRSTMEGTAMQANQIWLALSGREDAKTALTSAFSKMEGIE